MTRYAPGQTVDDRFQIQALLGTGGVSDVYRARDLQTGETVVLKTPLLSIAGDLRAYNALLRERDLVCRLDHPNVQRCVTDSMQVGSHDLYLVFTYVEGEDLRTYLRRSGPLPVPEVLTIGDQLAGALTFVHAQGVLHRDVKPDNVLIDPDGRVVLTDFGIAVPLGSRGAWLDHLADAVGTPDYMAPEQVRGQRGDARTDVYTLGILLYELLAGTVPPLPPDGAKQADPILVRHVRPDVPPALEAIVYRATRRRPAERYQTMSELLHDLEHLNAVALPSYRPDELPPQPLGDLPPWRKTALLLFVVFAVLVAIGVLSMALHHAPPR